MADARIERLCREICKAHGDDPDGLTGYAHQLPCWRTHIPSVVRTLGAIAAAGLKVVERAATKEMMMAVKPHAPRLITRHDVKTDDGRTRLEIHIRFDGVWATMFDAAPPVHQGERE